VGEVESAITRRFVKEEAPVDGSSHASSFLEGRDGEEVVAISEDSLVAEKSDSGAPMLEVLVSLP
jgi:hypothetical protein